MAVAGKKRSPLGDAAIDQPRQRPASLTPVTAQLLILQQAAGNRAVAQMLRDDGLFPLAEQTTQATDDSESTELEDSGLDIDSPEQQQQAGPSPEAGPETPTDDLDSPTPTDNEPETDAPEQQQQADLDSPTPTDNEPEADAPEQQQQAETGPEAPTDELDSSAPTDDAQPEADAPTTEAQADASADTAQDGSPAGPTSGSPGDTPESGAGNSPTSDAGPSEIDLSKFPELATLPKQRIPAGTPQRAPGATKAQLAAAVQKFWNIGKTFTSPKTASPDRVAQADRIYQKAMALAETGIQKRYVGKMCRTYVRHILRLGLRHFAGELSRQKQTLVTDGRNSPEYQAAIRNVATVRRLSRRGSTAKMQTLYELVRDSQAANEKPTGLEGRLREFSTAGTAAAPRRSPRRRRRRMTKMIRHRKRKEAKLPNLSVEGLTDAQKKWMRSEVSEIITQHNRTHNAIGKVRDRIAADASREAARTFKDVADLAVKWKAVGVLSMYIDKSGIKPWLLVVLKKEDPVLAAILAARPTLMVDSTKSNATQDFLVSRAMARVTGQAQSLAAKFIGTAAVNGIAAMASCLKQAWDMAELLGEASKANHTLSRALGYAYGLVHYALGTPTLPRHSAVQALSKSYWDRGVAEALKTYQHIARRGPAHQFVLANHFRTVIKMGGNAALQKIWPPIRDKHLARLQGPTTMYATIPWPPPS